MAPRNVLASARAFDSFLERGRAQNPIVRTDSILPDRVVQWRRDVTGEPSLQDGDVRLTEEAQRSICG